MPSTTLPHSRCASYSRRCDSPLHQSARPDSRRTLRAVPQPGSRTAAGSRPACRRPHDGAAGGGPPASGREAALLGDRPARRPRPPVRGRGGRVDARRGWRLVRPGGLRRRRRAVRRRRGLGPRRAPPPGLSRAVSSCCRPVPTACRPSAGGAESTWSNHRRFPLLPPTPAGLPPGVSTATGSTATSVSGCNECSPARVVELRQRQRRREAQQYELRA